MNIPLILLADAGSLFTSPITIGVILVVILGVSLILFNFLGIWIRLLLENRPFSVWGGDQLRDFNHVDDVVDALMLAVSSDAAAGQIFNLGGSQILTLRALADMLVEANGGGTYDVQQFPEERKRIDIGDYYADFTRFGELGWTPRVPLAKGLAETIEFYRSRLPRYL